MESFEAFTKRSEAQYEQQRILERQIHDSIEDIDFILHPRAYRQSENEAEVRDMPTLIRAFDQFSGEFLESLKSRAEEDAKLAIEVSELKKRVAETKSFLEIMSERNELIKADIEEWESLQKVLKETLAAIHMTRVGTMGVAQKMDRPESLN